MSDGVTTPGAASTDVAKKTKVLRVVDVGKLKVVKTLSNLCMTAQLAAIASLTRLRYARRWGSFPHHASRTNVASRKLRHVPEATIVCRERRAILHVKSWRVANAACARRGLRDGPRSGRERAHIGCFVVRGGSGRRNSGDHVVHVMDVLHGEGRLRSHLGIEGMNGMVENGMIGEQ